MSTTKEFLTLQNISLLQRAHTFSELYGFNILESTFFKGTIKEKCCVMHFLLSCVDEARASASFASLSQAKGVVRLTATDQGNFREIAYAWIQELRPILRFAPLTKTEFLSFSTKNIDLFYCLSRYAVRQSSFRLHRELAHAQKRPSDPVASDTDQTTLSHSPLEGISTITELNLSQRSEEALSEVARLAKLLYRELLCAKRDHLALAGVASYLSKSATPKGAAQQCSDSQHCNFSVVDAINSLTGLHNEMNAGGDGSQSSIPQLDREALRQLQNATSFGLGDLNLNVNLILAGASLLVDSKKKSLSALARFETTVSDGAALENILCEATRMNQDVMAQLQLINASITQFRAQRMTELSRIRCIPSPGGRAPDSVDNYYSRGSAPTDADLNTVSSETIDKLLSGPPCTRSVAPPSSPARPSFQQQEEDNLSVRDLLDGSPVPSIAPVIRLPERDLTITQLLNTRIALLVDDYNKRNPPVLAISTATRQSVAPDPPLNPATKLSALLKNRRMSSQEGHVDILTFTADEAAPEGCFSTMTLIGGTH